MVIVHHVTALLLHLIYKIPRRATRILLVALRALVRLTIGPSRSPEERGSADSLPVDIRTILGRFDLDPVTRPYICCPACYAIYPKPYPQVCSHKAAANSKPCGTDLWRSRTIRGRVFSFPLSTFLYQEMKHWLARLLARHQLEDIMDTMLQRAVGDAREIMSDLWDAPIFRELRMPDGTLFVDAPPGEARLIFGLAVDGFNPFHSKTAKQQVTVTGIYMYCLNLPPHLRYRPENMYLVGIIPGPGKPSAEQINHFLRPLVDELLQFWHGGVYYSRTMKFPDGRLVRCVLVPLVCDLPAARQTAGFGHYSAKYFCHMCNLQLEDMNELDMTKWGERTCEGHRAAAEAWRDLPSVSRREAAFKENSTRWSVLLELPYWDPIRFTVIDSMHNHYLGLLKRHCRKIWGMDIEAVDDDEDRGPGPSEEDLAMALDLFYTGTADDLSKCTRAVLKRICSILAVRYKKSSKTHMIHRLLEFVSQCAILYLHAVDALPAAYQGRSQEGASHRCGPGNWRPPSPPDDYDGHGKGEARSERCQCRRDQSYGRLRLLHA